jgi:heme/copper-type cytochrome/quinol oxidase subunit 2
VSAAVVVFLVCAVACAIAHVAILVSSVSARATVDSATKVPRPRALAEFVWALVPILALALVLTATWTRIRDNHKHPPETMKVAS